MRSTAIVRVAQRLCAASPSRSAVASTAPSARKVARPRRRSSRKAFMPPALDHLRLARGLGAPADDGHEERDQRRRDQQHQRGHPRQAGHHRPGSPAAPPSRASAPGRSARGTAPPPPPARRSRWPPAPKPAACAVQRRARGQRGGNPRAQLRQRCPRAGITRGACPMPRRPRAAARAAGCRLRATAPPRGPRPPPGRWMAHASNAACGSHSSAAAPCTRLPEPGRIQGAQAGERAGRGFISLNSCNFSIY